MHEIRTSETRPTQHRTSDSALVESAVQNVVDTAKGTDDFFGLLLEGLNEYHQPREAASEDKIITSKYEVAKRYKQATFAAGSFVVCLEAMPRMTAWHRQHGSLLPPKHAHEVLEACGVRVMRPGSKEDHKKEPEQYHKAISVAYWLVDTAYKLQNDAQADSRHPYAALFRHIDTACRQWGPAFLQWKEGRGKDRWPDIDKDYVDKTLQYPHIARACGTNGRTGVDLTAAKAFHYTLHKNPHASAQELIQDGRRAIRRSSWIASTNRHLGWHKDWRERDARGEPAGGTFPENLGQEMVKQPGQETAKTFYQATKEFRILRDENFCPHDTLQDGPWRKHMAACAGGVEVRTPAAARAKVYEFLAELGLPLEWGDKFGSALITVAVGHDASRHTIMPVWEQTAAAHLQELKEYAADRSDAPAILAAKFKQ